MPINSFLYPAPTNSNTFEVDNSLRFDDGSSDTLTRTVSSAGNRKTFTYSVWIKRGIVNAGMGLFGQGNRSSSDFDIRFESSGTIRIEPSGFDIKTNALHRDPSAWYHIVVAIDTTQSTSSDRVKMYINGNQVTSFATATYPSLNYDTVVNSSGSTGNVVIGDIFNSTGKFDGYMAEAVLIDGQQLDATSFGEFDNGTNIWKPKEVLTQLDFGTNGFYLEFKNASSLGTDSSTNGNNFTVNNLTSIDQTTDTCTNNFANLNSVFNLSGTLSEGNLKYATSDGYGSQGNTATSTIGVSSGKWYAEFKCGGTTGSFPNGMVGVYYNPEKFQNGATNPAQSNDEGFGYAENGNIYNNSSTSTGTTYTSGDIIGIALDLDGNKVYWYKNGTLVNSGGTTIDSGETYFFFIADTSGSGGTTFESNFGNPPFTISSGNSDGNGYGNFEYSVPSGYYALNSKNLAEYG